MTDTEAQVLRLLAALAVVSGKLGSMPATAFCDTS